MYNSNKINFRTLIRTFSVSQIGLTGNRKWDLLHPYYYPLEHLLMVLLLDHIFWLYRSEFGRCMPYLLNAVPNTNFLDPCIIQSLDKEIFDLMVTFTLS